MKHLVLILIIALCSVSALGKGTPPTRATTTSVNIYLVALSDDGYSGKRIGCGDSLVKEVRTISPTNTPLKSAIEELLAVKEPIKKRVDLELNNYWIGPDLKLKSATISRGTATIHFTGQISVAGVCDEPRITEQINAVAKQFASVKRVKVFVNGTALKQAIR
ncbi:MAG: GerMN domain-containing protein [Pyrinomonadaceae bacterium]